jgi:hypothetical protein
MTIDGEENCKLLAKYTAALTEEQAAFQQLRDATATVTAANAIKSSLPGPSHLGPYDLADGTGAVIGSNGINQAGHDVAEPKDRLNPAVTRQRRFAVVERSALAADFFVPRNGLPVGVGRAPM